jgi:hypothetical protein
LIAMIEAVNLYVILRKVYFGVFTLVFIMGCSPVTEYVHAEIPTTNAKESLPTESYPGSVPSRNTQPATPQYLFGVLNDAGYHYEDEWEHGVRATNLELHWDNYEPHEGVFDSQYINRQRQNMADLKSQGWYVQLVPGFHYVPEWVFTNYPDMYPINQYGEIYNPDPFLENDRRVINAPFNPQARALIARYLEHLLTESFPQDDPAYRFDSIRIGGGPQGELRYPTRFWNDQTNSYWAFDQVLKILQYPGYPKRLSVGVQGSIQILDRWDVGSSSSIQDSKIHIRIIQFSDGHRTTRLLPGSIMNPRILETPRLRSA